MHPETTGNNGAERGITEFDAAHIRFREKHPLDSYLCFSCGKSFEATSILNVIEHFGRTEHTNWWSDCSYCGGKVHKYRDKTGQFLYYHDCSRWKRGEDK